MNMSKSRDIQAKMPSPKVIFYAFWLVTVKVLNSYVWKTIGIAFAVIIVVCIVLIVMNIAFFSAYPTTEDVQTHEETIMLEE